MIPIQFDQLRVSRIPTYQHPRPAMTCAVPNPNLSTTNARFAPFLCAQNRPRRGLRAEAAYVRTPTGCDLGKRSASKVLALGYIAPIALSLGRALRLRLRGVANGLGQHLTQLRLGLWRFPRTRRRGIRPLRLLNKAEDINVIKSLPGLN
jgi:hypothetical protein